MVSYKKSPKMLSDSDSGITIDVVLDSAPNKLIGIKTSRVYSQIARMSRDPDKKEARILLITALEQAYIRTIDVNGRTIKKDPPYVSMRADDFKLCFGKRVKRLPEASVVSLP